MSAQTAAQARLCAQPGAARRGQSLRARCVAQASARQDTGSQPAELFQLRRREVLSAAVAAVSSQVAPLPAFARPAFGAYLS